MNDEKVYYPETVEENPFPDEDAIIQVIPTSPSGTYSPNTTKIKPLPKKKVAFELLSRTLNTQSRKILGKFEFTQSGAIQIGDFQQGISGELRLTPNGLTARDSAGLTTLNIDGTTGDATFRGTLQANDFVVADESGLHSINVFQSDSISSGATNSTTSSSFVDIPNSTLTTPYFNRTTRVLVFFLNSTNFAGQAAGDYAGHIRTAVNIDGVNRTVLNHKGYSVTGDQSAVDVLSLSGQYIATLGLGEHTIKLQWYIEQSSGTNARADSIGFDIGYVVLGS